MELVGWSATVRRLQPAEMAPVPPRLRRTVAVWSEKFCRSEGILVGPVLGSARSGEWNGQRDSDKHTFTPSACFSYCSGRHSCLWHISGVWAAVKHSRPRGGIGWEADERRRKKEKARTRTYSFSQRGSQKGPRQPLAYGARGYQTHQPWGGLFRRRRREGGSRVRREGPPAGSA